MPPLREAPSRQEPRMNHVAREENMACCDATLRYVCKWNEGEEGREGKGKGNNKAQYTITIMGEYNNKGGTIIISWSYHHYHTLSHTTHHHQITITTSINNRTENTIQRHHCFAAALPASRRQSINVITVTGIHTHWVTIPHIIITSLLITFLHMSSLTTELSSLHYYIEWRRNNELPHNRSSSSHTHTSSINKNT